MGERNRAGYVSKSSRQDCMQALAEEARALAAMPEKGKHLGLVTEHDFFVVASRLPARYLDEPG